MDKPKLELDKPLDKPKPVLDKSLDKKIPENIQTNNKNFEDKQKKHNFVEDKTLDKYNFENKSKDKNNPLKIKNFDKSFRDDTYSNDKKDNNNMNITNYLLPDCNVIRNDILNGRIKKENFSYLSSKCNNSIKSVL